MSGWSEREASLLLLTIGIQVAMIAVAAFVTGRLARQNSVVRHALYLTALFLTLLSPILSAIGQRCQLALSPYVSNRPPPPER